MSMVINTNTASLIAQAAQARTDSSMETAMERLSTGKRINSSADDAAGMAMSARMESQIRGLSMAMRNAGDAQSLIDATEGAHDEITNVLHRMRELSVQAANSTNVASDVSNIQTEMTQLIAEIDRIAGQTSWNGMNLLDGSFASKQFQIGPEASQTVSVTVANAGGSQIGAYQAEATGHLEATAAGVDAVAIDATGTVTITGSKGSSDIAQTTTDSAKSFAAKVNAEVGSTGVTATAITQLLISGNNIAGGATSGPTATTLNMDINGTSIAATAVTATDLRNLRDAINAISGTTGVAAKMGATNLDLILTDADGDNILIDNYTAADDDAAYEVAVLNTAGSAGSAVVNADTTADYGNYTLLSDTTETAGFEQILAVGAVSFSSTASFTVTGTDALTETSSDLVKGDLTSSLSTISTVNVTTVAGANSAINAIDGAIDMITSRRADLGAVSNRLDHTMSNLSTSRVNMEASQSRIEDADFAVETSNLTKAQILSQAATAMLAQANASKQSVLSLLQG
ncbi:flagellin [Planktomarina temperata]|nr:flagellin [Planktomarina temperata]